jgi:hypothetical protein
MLKPLHDDVQLGLALLAQPDCPLVPEKTEVLFFCIWSASKVAKCLVLVLALGRAENSA